MSNTWITYSFLQIIFFFLTTISFIQGEEQQGCGYSVYQQNVFSGIPGRTFALPGGRVIGGQSAMDNSWPWQVLLSICGYWSAYLNCGVCGGSILSKNWVITAAHCIPTRSLQEAKVFYGSHFSDLGSISNKVVTADHITHDKFDSMTFDFDIALLHTPDIPFDDEHYTAKPVCLPHSTTHFETGFACVVTGFGVTDTGSYSLSPTLQEVAVRKISAEDCRTFTNYGGITINMQCAGYIDGVRDSCTGDSGGPLVCRVPGSNTWVLEGLVSWGYGCAQASQPGVYTKVQEFLEWIENYTGLEPSHGLDIGDDGEYLSGTEAVAVSQAESLDADQNLGNWLNLEPSCDYTQTTNSYGNEIRSDNFAKSGKINSEVGTHFSSPNRECSYQITNTDNDKYAQLIISKDARIYCAKNIDSESGQQNTGLYITAKYTGQMYRFCRVTEDTVLKDKYGFHIQWARDESLMEASSVSQDIYGIAWSFEHDPVHMCGNDNQPPSVTLVTGESAEFSTELKNGKYSANSQCRWHYKSDSGDGFILSTESFKTEEGIKCNENNDNLIIVSAENCFDEELMSSGRIVGAVCGLVESGNFEIYESSVCIIFKADNDVNVNTGGTFTITAM